MTGTEPRQTGLPTRLIVGVGWNVVATAFNQGSTFLVAILAARILGRDTFGEYAMLLSTLVTGSNLAQLAMGYTVAKYVAEYRNKDKARTGRIMALCWTISLATGLVSALALAGGAPWLATHALGAATLALPLALGSVYLLFSILNGYQMGALAGFEGYRNLARAGIVSGVCSVVAVSFGAWRFGLMGAVIGLGVAGVVRWFVHAWWLRLALRREAVVVNWAEMWQEAQVLWRFAVPAAICGFLTMPAIWAANAILVNQRGGFAAMAEYTAATNIRILILWFPNVINTVSLSILNNERGRGDRLRYERVFKLNFFLIGGVALMAALAAGSLGATFLSAFGRDFLGARPVLWLLVASTVPESISLAILQYIQSNERLWLTFFAVNAPRDTLLVVLALFLVPLYGALGLALAYLGAQLLSLVSHATVAGFVRRQLATPLLSGMSA